MKSARVVMKSKRLKERSRLDVLEMRVIELNYLVRSQFGTPVTLHGFCEIPMYNGGAIDQVAWAKDHAVGYMLDNIRKNPEKYGVDIQEEFLYNGNKAVSAAMRIPAGGF